MARLLYPSGILIDSLDRQTALSATAVALNHRVPLFEAAFQHRSGFTRVDILAPVESNAWDLIEVKSSTAKKEVHLEDLAFQAHVLAEAGIRLRKVMLVLVNNGYVRQGELRADELFLRTDLTEEVLSRLPSVEQNLVRFVADAATDAPPTRSIGPHCNDPYPCPLQDACWAYLPPRNVSSLYRGVAKGFEFLAQGIIRLADIEDEDSLTEHQRIQRWAAIHGQAHVDRDQIGAFLQRLEYPAYFMDFETFASAIPLLDGVRPYEQVPFQFSVHAVAHQGAPPEHHDFLAEGQGDPRPEFLARLRQVIGDRGSVVVYNKTFELGRLRECQAAFPEYGDLVDNIESRIIDLLEPFRSFAFHHPDQEGSCSIKAVLPVLAGQSYSHLAIQDGAAASREFVRVTFQEVDAKDRVATRAALRAYCGQDTLGMVQIVQSLYSLAAAGAKCAVAGEGAIGNPVPATVPPAHHPHIAPDE